ncbi:MAG: hypothetical protein FJ390_05035 [Verrucomicrobia bacterium]|nr:hypothetical protein [Verrucomicrobiota bacterium]
MKVKKFFLALLFAFAFVKGVQAAELSSDQIRPILVSDYQIFLTAVAATQDLHKLWQSEMGDQICCEEAEGQKVYTIVDGHGEEPMQHITEPDEMRYRNWKDHGCPDEKEDPAAAALSTESGGYDLEKEQRSSPLIFGCCWGEK